MQTRIASQYRGRADIERAEQILRKCVHCGFCLATCPTYTQVGNELDSPRGRIYQIKQVLEGATPTARIQHHLDRCLTCRSCETTCPSGVEYGQLVDIGRQVMEGAVARPAVERIRRNALNRILPYKERLAPLVGIGRLARPLLPSSLAGKIPPRQQPRPTNTESSHTRTMLALGGCAQPVLTPATDAALARILDRFGITLVTPAASGCCGAVSWHLSNPDESRRFMRRNIDAWWPALEAGAEAVLISASGCGAMVNEYATILADEPEYIDKAKLLREKLRDPAQVLETLDLKTRFQQPVPTEPIAFHAPCTLQHGLKLPGLVERILESCGFRLQAVDEAHICCGSAGTYSILQPQLSEALKTRKLRHLQSDPPAQILTANIGCQLHLQSGTEIPVRHWLEVIDDLMSPPEAS